MKRPLLVWLVFAACALVGGVVLGWFTREMLRLDHESSEARRLASVEENIRLALWRMDSALASIHGLEASRPAGDYAPFVRPTTAYSRELEPLPTGDVALPSPLLGYVPPFVRLHFQLEPDGSVHSPQAPAPGLHSAAAVAGFPVDRLEAARTLLEEFRPSLAAANLAETLPPAPLAPFSTAAGNTPEKKFDWNISLRRDKDRSAAQVAEPAPPPPPASAPRNEAVVQQLKAEAEQRERAATVDLSSLYNAEIAGNRERSQAPVVSRGESDDRRQAATLADARPAPAASAAPRGRPSSARNEAAADAEDEAPAEAKASAPVSAESATTGLMSTGPLHALWAGDELVFARRAMVDARPVVQGAWLDWPELQAWLLSRVSDLLPQAQLVPAQPGTATSAADAARRLAFLPAQLVPGTVNIPASTLTSPLRLSIAIAWAGAAVGLVALALLLRGTLRLSERRGAFVSAVTHELRTPLTTFRMYTEMLASGMVTDESKRRGYVDTLHRESERLSHLVENVLSYARLERGRAAARVEDTTPGALLGRIEERLRQRAQQGGLEVRVEFEDEAAELPLRTDTTAVEQVLFNLVDNATKYGRPKDGGGEITISVARGPGANRLALRITDQGPGLTPAARKRLFQPFSKSATEAAHTQPGVGLGLALCRRLARDELHGDLVLERSAADGTVFRLELPLS